jgi:uncharacterized protein (DUF3084 family)
MSSSSYANEREAEAFRASLTNDLTYLGNQLTVPLQQRAGNIHNNSSNLATQQRNLEKQTSSLRKQEKSWQTMVDQGRGRLKELGDVQNWAELLERDLAVLEETYRIVDGEEAVVGHGNGAATNSYSSGSGNSWTTNESQRK